MVINYNNILGTLKKVLIGAVNSDIRLAINKDNQKLGAEVHNIGGRVYIGRMQLVGIAVGDCRECFTSKRECFNFNWESENRLGRAISKKLVELSVSEVYTLKSLLDTLETICNTKLIRKYIETIGSLLGIEYIIKSGKESVVSIVDTLIYTGTNKEITQIKYKVPRDRDIDRILNRLTVHIVESNMKIAI